MLISSSYKCNNCKQKREVVQELKEGLKVPEIAKLSNSMNNSKSSNSSKIINKVSLTEQHNRITHKIKVQEVVLAQLSVKFLKEIVYHKCHSNMLPNNKLKL